MSTPARKTSKSAALRQLELLSDELLALDLPEPERLVCTLASARERAERALSAYSREDAGAASVACGFAGAVLAALATDAALPAGLLDGLVARLQARGLVSAAALGREALREPALIACEPARAGEAVLRLLAACAAPRSVSL